MKIIPYVRQRRELVNLGGRKLWRWPNRNSASYDNHSAEAFGSRSEDFSKPFNLNKQVYGYFSSWINSSRSLVQNVSQNAVCTQKSLARTLLQASNNNLCLSRNVTKFSLKTGKKKSVYPVLTRFYRLNCGLWIRRRAGCHKRLHRKNHQMRYGAVQHVFCTKGQSIMLDKMITDYHKKRKYYIDDPFEPYQERNNFDWVLPRKKR